MKILHKLLIGYFVVALLTFVVGYAAVHESGTIKAPFDLVTGEVLPSIRALESLRSNALRVVASSVELGYLHTVGAKDQYRAEVDLLHASVTRLKANLDVCEKLMGNVGEERYLFRTVGQKARALMDASDLFIRATSGAASPARYARSKEAFEEAERAFLRAIDAAVQHENSEMEESRELLARGLTQAFVVVPAVSGLTFLLAICCGGLVSASIAGRLRRLEKGVEQVSRGDLDVRLPVESVDEIGTLSSAFNGMVQELTRSKDELVTTNSYLDRIIRCMADSLFVVSCDGIILSVNPAACQMLRYRQEDLVGHPFSTVFHDGLQCATLLEVLNRDGILREVELSCRNSDGEELPASFSASVMDNVAASRTHVCIAHDISARKRAEQEIEQLAYYDTLTGLPNRLLFSDRLRQGMARAQREKTKLALLFFDLDRFKDINDTLGHACGDLLLQAVAQRLTTFVRRSDTLARLGGDEFVLLLNNSRQAVNVETVAKKIMELFEVPFELEGNEVYVTTSIGIVFYPTDGTDATTLLRNADLAMYAAKETGRNAYQFFSAEMNLQAQERKALEDLLRKALLTDQFTLHYQPQVDLKTGRIYGVEALLRWWTPERGNIPPAVFIPVAEQTGMMRAVGEWVLREACRQGRTWIDAGYRPMRIAVNVSGTQFLHPAFHTVVESILTETGLDPTLLELEITESVFMSDPKETALSLARLKELQVQLAVDDFGTGYSSLSYLMNFPLDRLKVDKSFIAGIAEKAHSTVIVDAVIAMGHSLGLRVLAEGVETAQELAYLKEQGCDEAQGYLFARPMPAADVERLFAASRAWEEEEGDERGGEVAA